MLLLVHLPGPKTTTTSRWSTRTAPCWPGAGSPTTRPDSPCCCSSWPSATTRRPIPVAIETSRGLLVACLRATGRPVFPINPMAVSRYRDRYSVARKKSDAGDALVLANILRTDLAAHRPLPADSELAQAIAVLARAQQDAVWDRTDAHNKLRSVLREYYPAILDAFARQARWPAPPRGAGPARRRPHPTAAAQLTRPAASTAHRAGLQRNIDAEADRLQQVLPREYLHHRRSSKRPSAARPWPCCVNSTRPAPAPTTSPPRPPALRPAPRRRDHHQPARPRPAHRCPDSRRDRRRPNPLHRRPSAQGLRRRRAGHPRQRQAPPSCTVGSRTSASPRPATSGPSPRYRLTRRPRPLRPPQSRRRPPHRRPTQPVQPLSVDVGRRVVRRVCR